MGINIEGSGADLEKRWKEEEQKRRNRESRPSNFAPEERFVLRNGEDAVVRVVDVPQDVWYAFITTDDNKIKLFKYPDPQDFPEYFLYRVVHHVLDKKWKGKDAEGKSIWEYTRKDQAPEVFQMVFSNNRPKGDFGFEGWVKDGYLPNHDCYIQAINRSPQEYEIEVEKEGKTERIKKVYDADWCFKNNHTLLLTKSEKGSFCAFTVKKELMGRLYPDQGSFFGYDVAITKLKKDPWYNVRRADQLEGPGAVNIAKWVVRGNLPEEAKKIETYKLADMAKPATHKYIYDNLRTKIKMIDDAYGTKFSSELAELAEKEEEGKSGGRPVSKEEKREESASEEKSMVSLEALRKVAPNATQKAADMVKEIQGTKVVWMDKYKHSTIECPKCKIPQPEELSQGCVFCGEKFST